MHQFEHASCEQLLPKETHDQEAHAHMDIIASMDPPKVAKSFEQPCTHITFLPQIKPTSQHKTTCVPQEIKCLCGCVGGFS